MEQRSSSSLYSRLDVSKKEIRVLKLSPIPSEDGPIHCWLSTIALEDGMDFVPLSYVWGEASQTTEIFVNGVSFQATLNLVAFFRHYKFLSNNYQERAIWVDAICIDQSDDEERGQQIKLMADIYERPTISWLGPESKEEKSALAIKWIHQISKDIFDADDITSRKWLENHASDLLKGTGWGPVWTSIASLLRRSYWSRVWTLQETVLPTENVFLCGAHCFCLSQLLRIFEALEYLSTEGKHLLNPSLSSTPRDEHRIRQSLTTRGSILDGLGFKVMQIIRLLKGAQQEPGQSDDDPTCDSAPFRAWRVTYMMRTLKATDSRDHIYGAMGMRPGPLISVDYKKTTRDLFLEHTSMAINTISQHQQAIFVTGVLSITGHQREDSLLRNTLCLPSWIPSWGDRDMESQFWLNSYDASGLRKLTNRVARPGPIATEATLRVSGVICSEIQFLQKRNDENLLQFMMAILNGFNGAEYPLSQRFQDFLRVFIKDLDPKSIENRIAPNDRKAFLEYACSLLVYLLQEDDEEVMRRLYGINLWHEPGPRYSRDKGDLRRLFEDLGLDSKGGIAENFWDPLFPNKLHLSEDSVLPVEIYEELVYFASERLIAIKSLDMVSKKSCETVFRARNGYLGTTFSEVLPGDLICVLFGCNLPVVLRKVDNYYLHIGLCFVLGLMDGEVIQDVEDGRFAVEEFNIH